MITSNDFLVISYRILCIISYLEKYQKRNRGLGSGAEEEVVCIIITFISGSREVSVKEGTITSLYRKSRAGTRNRKK